MRKCPRCELNYIKGDQDICEVCMKEKYLKIRQKRYNDKGVVTGCFLVFQNATFHEEVIGGYLWAPDCEGANAKSHWLEMHNVYPGDFILHSNRQNISVISIAKSSAYSAKRPSSIFNQWDNEGLKIDVECFVFSKCINTAVHMNKLLKMQPDYYAPFNVLGRGNTGYLFRVNKEMVEYVLNETLKLQNEQRQKDKLEYLLEKFHERYDDKI